MTFRPRWTHARLLMLVALPAAALLLPGLVTALALPALSPFLGVSSALATRSAMALLYTVPMLALILWRRRFFCRHMCPMGLLVETCAKARPRTRRDYPRVPRIGQWLALITFGGAVVGMPLFLLLDPLTMFTGAANVGAGHVAYALLFGFVIALSLVYPMLWCHRLCPLGGLQEFIADSKDASHGLARGTGTIWAVWRRFLGKTPPPKSLSVPVPRSLSRRALLGLTGGAAVGFAATRVSLSDANARLRPPGAVDEHTLRALCIRCGSCVRACPAGIILPDLAPAGVTALLVPMLRFDNGYCHEDCTACGDACPTGAIARLPLAEKNERRIGLARIDADACLLSRERECSVCVPACPRAAIAEEFSRETYTAMVGVIDDACNGCGACVVACPVDAIAVEADKG